MGRQKAKEHIKAIHRGKSSYSNEDIAIFMAFVTALAIIAIVAISFILPIYKAAPNQLMVMGKAIESYTTKHPEEKFPEQENIYSRDYVLLYDLQNAKGGKEGFPVFVNIDVKTAENKKFFTICTLKGKTRQVYSSKTNTVIEADKCPL